MQRLAGGLWLIAFVALGSFAIAQVSLGELQSLTREQRDAERAYLALVDAPPQPSMRVVARRQRITELTTSIATNIGKRDAYSRGDIVLPDDERLRVINGLTETITAEERQLAQFSREMAEIERVDMQLPVERAWDRWVAATNARDAALARAQAAQGPMTVTNVAIFEDAGKGRPLVSGRWVQGQDAPAERAVVLDLEATLDAVRREIGRLRAQNLAIAEQLQPAGIEWNFANQILIERHVWDSRRDIALQLLADALDVGFAVSSAGTWTVVRVTYTVGESALRVRSAYLAGVEMAATFTALEQSTLSAEIEAAIVARIAGDLAGGRPLDLDVLLDPSAPLPTAPAGGTATSRILDGLSTDQVQSAISAIISYFENTGREMVLSGVLPADRLLPYVWVAALQPSKQFLQPDALWRVAGEIGASQDWIDLAVDELKGFRNSVALSAIPGAGASLQDLYRALTGQPTDADLTRWMLAAELRVFILSEALRQSRALTDAQLKAEPRLAAELTLARQRLLAASHRSFEATSGGQVDPQAMLTIPQLTGPLTVWAAVDNARAPWRLDVVHVVGDKETVVARGAGLPGAQSSTTARIDPARLAMPLTAPARVEIRITSGDPGEQDVDGDPATSGRLDPRSLAWAGWEPGPDRYGFGIAAVCAPALAPGYVAGPVVSTFERDAEGWRLAGDAGPAPQFAPGEIGGVDKEDSAVWYFQAPAKFLGDRLSLFGTGFTYRVRVSPLTNPFEAADVVLESPGMTLNLDTDSPVDSWTSYAHKLDASSPWTIAGGTRRATDADIQRVLKCLSGLKIRGEFRSGPDTGWLSRVTFGTPGAPPGANVLTNGSFELGPDPGRFVTLAAGSNVINGWTVINGSSVTKGTIDYVGGYMPASNGGRHLDLDGTPGAGGIQQTFPTFAGIAYELTFDLAGNPGGPPQTKQLRVEAAGQSVDFFYGGGLDWSRQSWQFRAAGSETTLRFRSLSETSTAIAGPLLDNVSVHILPR